MHIENLKRFSKNERKKKKNQTALHSLNWFEISSPLIKTYTRK